MKAKVYHLKKPKYFPSSTVTVKGIPMNCEAAKVFALLNEVEREHVRELVNRIAVNTDKLIMQLQSHPQKVKR